MHRIERFLKHLAAAQWQEQIELQEWTVEEVRYITAGRYKTITPRTSSDRTLKSAHGITYMLEASIEIPSSWSDTPAALLFSAGGGEGLLKLNGEFYHGLDRNHQFVPLRNEHSGQQLHIEIELYDPIPEPHDPLNGQPEFVAPLTGFTSSLVRINSGLRSLMHSVRLLRDAAYRLPEGELQRSHIQTALEQCMQAAYDLPQESWQLTEPWNQLKLLLQEQVKPYAPSADQSGRMIMVGQSHIDIAWLWPIRETVRKTSRTFSTMCTLLEQYPEFVYTQSQPQLFAYVKDHYPELYQKVKGYIAEGRWELVGGMWVEPDLNIPSGESLARQLLYGQRFYREEFNQTSKIEWLPDTFGYAASLPQLLRLAEIDYFMTTKLNWNDTNIFPYDLFQWIGIDGTPVLSYLNHGVNESTTVKDIDEHWQSFRQKDLHPEQMLLYGHGDGGGGVTEDMVEYVQHADWMIGQPKAEFGTAREFFEHTSEKADELPVWRGDLYLELHRGTYTTQAKNKRYNRKAEILYREAEVWERLAALYLNQNSLAKKEHESTPDVYINSNFEDIQNTPAAAYSVSPLIWNQPAELRNTTVTADQFKQGWIGIMLNQFHDIVPGSAITEVYHTSDVEYEEIMRIGQQALDQALKLWTDSLQLSGDGIPYAVFNSLGWTRGEWLEWKGGSELVGIQIYDEHGVRLSSDLIREESAELPSSGDSAPELKFTAAQKKLPGRVPYGSAAEQQSNADGEFIMEQVSQAQAGPDMQEQDTYRLRVYVPSIPAFGYRVIWMRAETQPPAAQPVSEQRERIHDADYTAADRSSLQDDLPILDRSVPASWETNYYRIGFNEQGEMISLYDKEYDREIFQSGHAGNSFGYYHDRPTLWDAWDIDPHFAEQPAGRAQLVSSQVMMNGSTGDILRFHWQVGESSIRQDMYLYTNHRRIDFKTEVNWQESHKLLKVNFPVDLIAEQATYEIPFGALDRTMNNNTSWERAQFEVCGHRWAGVSEGDYGVSLMNDCKYGYDIKNGHMRLSLLRAPKWPDIEADIGEHTFMYSLLPHGGSWRQAHVVRAAAELNQPAPFREVNRYSVQADLIHQNAAAKPEDRADDLQPYNHAEDHLYNIGKSLLEYESEHVILDTIKPAEDGDGTIFRLYESSGSRSKAVIRYGTLTGQTNAAEGEWIVTNLLEDEREILSPTDGTLLLTFKPYEIKTLKWKRGIVS